MIRLFRDSIRVFLRGGLGNQLFCWAAGYALASRNKVPLTLIANGIHLLGSGPMVSPRSFELGFFGASAVESKFRSAPKPNSAKAWLYRNTCRLAGRTVYTEPSTQFDPRFEHLGSKTDIHGYFQSWLYFADKIEEIRRELRQKFEPSDKFLRLRDQLGNEPWLGIHVRLGDYRTLRTMHFVDASALRAAQDRLKKETGIDKIVLFSDNIRDALALLPGASMAISACELPRPADNIYFMGLADGNIFSNSTFSWWSALLHQKAEAPKYFPDHWNSHATTPRDGFLLPTWRTYRA